MTDEAEQGFLPGMKDDSRLQQQMFEQIAMGVEAKRFMESKLATFVCESAEQKVIDAQNKLGVVNPSDTREIVRLQAVIARFAHFTECLQELVAAGDSAYQLYLQTYEKQEE